MSKFFSGANITAQVMDIGGMGITQTLDELKISKFLDERIKNDNVVKNYAFQTMDLHTIMDQNWNIVFKQAGIEMDQCVDIYGVDGSTMQSIDMQFYYPSEHIEEPLPNGKKYKVDEIT